MKSMPWAYHRRFSILPQAFDEPLCLKAYQPSRHMPTRVFIHIEDKKLIHFFYINYINYNNYTIYPVIALVICVIIIFTFFY